MRNKFGFVELHLLPLHDSCFIYTARQSGVTSQNLNSQINCRLHFTDSSLMGLSQGKKKKKSPPR